MIDVTDTDLSNIAKALEPVTHVPYAPPHVFPMSTPVFQEAPKASRAVPSVEDPLGIYLHIPFCRYACNFCFYVKRIGADHSAMRRYLEALAKELQYIPEGTLLSQLFVGGGTPTALSPELLDEALTAALERMDRRREGVHTVECSPETLTDEHLEVMRKHGIKRVSMGVQTFSNDVLRTVHRRHTGEQALDACRRLAASGMMVNIDLIYGLPGQTKEMFRRDFEELASLNIHSVNAYSLRVNESTPVMKLLHDQERLELERLYSWRSFVQDIACQAGYEQRHWQRFLLPGIEFELDLTSSNLLGAGASARSFLDNTVYRNHTRVETYIDLVECGASPVQEIFPLTREYQRTYFITRTLGAGKVLDYDAYSREFQSCFQEDYRDVCRPLLEAGLVEDLGGRLAMTSTGKLLYDLVTLAFYPEHLKKWLNSRYQKAAARRIG